MKPLKVLRLGQRHKDRATLLNGRLTHWIIGMSGQITYMFQPGGLTSEGQPHKLILVVPERLDESFLGEDSWEELEIPVEILGSQVTNDASGFAGMATHLVQHINGCFHVEIQPAGLVSGTGKIIEPREFDLRECSGEKIVPMTAEERRASEAARPSPTGDQLPPLRG